MSHPSRVRGLKFRFRFHRLDRGQVAPFTGAWIEIKDYISYAYPKCWSHPSRVRGLKSSQKIIAQAIIAVAPFTGAWIEIAHIEKDDEYFYRVAPFTGAWIEIYSRAQN